MNGIEITFTYADGLSEIVQVPLISGCSPRLYEKIVRQYVRITREYPVLPFTWSWKLIQMDWPKPKFAKPWHKPVAPWKEVK